MVTVPPAFSASRDEGFFASLQSSLDQRRRDGSHADFVITCRGGTPLHAHKIILATACPYFEALLSSGMSEADSGELKLDNIERDLMETLLGYMYTGDIHVEYEQIQQLIAACELLQLVELKAKCEQYLIGSVSVETCIGVCANAATYGMTRLEKTCTEMIKSQFGDIIKVREFLELDLAQLVDCIKMLDIEKPEDIVQGCINWVLHGEEERKGLLQDLINHVDLKTCSRSYLEQIAKEYEGLFHSVQVKFTQAFSRPMDPPGQNIDTLWAASNVGKWTVMKYDKTQWLPCGDHTIVHEDGRAHVTAIPGGFLLTGGQLDGSQCKNTFKHFSFRIVKWTDLPSIPNHRCRHSSVYVDDSLFVFGGMMSCCKGAAPLSIDIFDFTKHTWTSKSECFNVVFDPLSVEFNGTIYVFCNQSSLNKDHPHCVQSYDINNNKWMKRSPIPNAIKVDGTGNAISYGDHIYVLGGADKICTRYNVAMDAWTILTRCINEHAFGGVLLNHNKIILIGGYTEEAEEYDIAADKWMNCAKFRLKKLTWSKIVVGHF